MFGIDIKRTFNNEDFEKEKALIRQEFEQKRTTLLEKLNEQTMKHGFQVKTAENRYIYDACFKWYNHK